MNDDLIQLYISGLEKITIFFFKSKKSDFFLFKSDFFLFKSDFFLFKSDFFGNCSESSISSYKLQNL